jgi:hypothetical protein
MRGAKGEKRRIWRRRSGEQEIIKEKEGEGGKMYKEWRGKMEEGRNRGEGGASGSDTLGGGKVRKSV